ncbi:MAG TPA: hypothetical protein VF267_14585 [Gammaproteobacteria bacterium]
MTVANLEDYFRESLARATKARSVTAGEATQYYVVHLLVGFARVENLFEQTRQGTGSSFELRPLAMMLADAFETQAGPERNLQLRRLGDVALFISGFFGESLERRPVDIDYYSRMGEAAYSTLLHSPASRRDEALADVYSELSENFLTFVDALADIAQEARVFNERDILRLYDVWLRTGSERAAEILQRLGIEPARGSRSSELH